jgi:hypothetical protein
MSTQTDTHDCDRCGQRFSTIQDLILHFAQSHPGYSPPEQP